MPRNNAPCAIDDGNVRNDRLAYRLRVDADIAFVGAAATLLKQWRLEEAERIWEGESARDTRVPGVFNPGDEVVYTAKRISQMNGGPLGGTEVFVIRACACELCALGDHVCTTEWNAGYDAFKHVSRCAVRHRGAAHVDDVPMGMQALISIPRLGDMRALNREDRKALGLTVCEVGRHVCGVEVKR